MVNDFICTKDYTITRLDGGGGRTTTCDACCRASVSSNARAFSCAIHSSGKCGTRASLGSVIVWINIQGAGRFCWYYRFLRRVAWRRVTERVGRESGGCKTERCRHRILQSRCCLLWRWLTCLCNVPPSFATSLASSRVCRFSSFFVCACRHCEIG